MPHDPNDLVSNQPVPSRWFSERRGFPEGVREVTILRDGPRRVIVPASAVWDDFFDAPGVDIAEREQPRSEARELL